LLHSRERDRGEERGERRRRRRRREGNHKVVTRSRHTQVAQLHNCHSCCSCMVSFDYNALTIAKVPHKVVRFWPWPVPSSQREKRLCVFLVLVRAREWSEPERGREKTTNKAEKERDWHTLDVSMMSYGGGCSLLSSCE